MMNFTTFDDDPIIDEINRRDKVKRIRIIKSSDKPANRHNRHNRRINYGWLFKILIIGVVIFLAYCAGKSAGMSQVDKSTQKLMTAYEQDLISYENLVQAYEKRERERASVSKASDKLPGIETWGDIRIPTRKGAK